MLLEPIAKSPSYEIEDSSGYDMNDGSQFSGAQTISGSQKQKNKAAYNIDLFQGSEEEEKKKPPTVKSSGGDT